MNPGDVERFTITSYGRWNSEVVHSTVAEQPPVRGSGGDGVWSLLTSAGHGGFDRLVRMRITFHPIADPTIVTYPSGADATAHRGQEIDDPELVAGVMRWYVDQVLPRRVPGMRRNWTKDVTPRD